MIKRLLIMLLVLITPSLAFAVVNSVTIEGGAVSKVVYKNTPFQIAVQVDFSNETTLTVTGAWSSQSISCDSSSVQVSGGVATFIGCTIPTTGTYTFTATCGGKYDTMDFISDEIPAWSISLANVTNGTNVKVTLTIDPAGSTLEGVTANITTPNGWTMTSGTTTRSLGDITGITDVQWIFTSGGTGTLSDITVTVIVTNPADSKSKSFSITTTTTSTSTTTTMSGETTTTTTVPTGAARIVHKHIHSWSVMRPGVVNVVHNIKKEIGLRQINIEVKNPVNNVRITVTKLEERPASVIHEVRGRVYRYIEINAENLISDDISTAEIEFEVEKAWINNNRINKNTIALNRYHNEIWERLRTRIINETDAYIVYKAEATGFSFFAITGETAEEVTTTTTTTTTSTTIIPTTTIIRETTTTLPEEVAPDYTWVLFAVVIIIILALGFFGFKKGL